VRKGLLSRWLLPFDEDTSSNDQSKAHIVHGKTIRITDFIPNALDESNGESKIMLDELENGKEDLITLRATIRVKIADDNDLNQAKTVCYDIIKFFNDLTEFSRNNDKKVSDVIKECFMM